MEPHRVTAPRFPSNLWVRPQSNQFWRGSLKYTGFRSFTRPSPSKVARSIVRLDDVELIRSEKCEDLREARATLVNAAASVGSNPVLGCAGPV